MKLDRITTNLDRMNGQPCIRNLRLTVRRVLELLATYPDRKELKTTITDENSLDDGKQTALTQVKKIAEAAQKPEDTSLQKKAEKAVGFLEIIAKGLEPASKLAQAVAKALPTIIHFFGF